MVGVVSCSSGPHAAPWGWTIYRKWDQISPTKTLHIATAWLNCDRPSNLWRVDQHISHSSEPHLLAGIVRKLAKGRCPQCTAIFPRVLSCHCPCYFYSCLSGSFLTDSLGFCVVTLVVTRILDWRECALHFFYCANHRNTCSRKAAVNEEPTGKHTPVGSPMCFPSWSCSFSVQGHLRRARCW